MQQSHLPTQRDCAAPAAGVSGLRRGCCGMPAAGSIGACDQIQTVEKPEHPESIVAACAAAAGVTVPSAWPLRYACGKQT